MKGSAPHTFKDRAELEEMFERGECPCCGTRSVAAGVRPMLDRKHALLGATLTTSIAPRTMPLATAHPGVRVHYVLFTA